MNKRNFTVHLFEKNKSEKDNNMGENKKQLILTEWCEDESKSESPEEYEYIVSTNSLFEKC